MQIVITIDDKDYTDIMTDSLRNLNHYERLIKNGTPLDKIRAEIEKLQTYVLCKGDTKKIELADVLEIIDKYKAETEET